MSPSRLTLTEHNILNQAAIEATAADAATVLHGVLGGVVALHILTHDQPNWVEWGVHAAASALDKTDGFLKDRAVKMASGVLFPAQRSLRDKQNHPTVDEWEVLNRMDVHDRPQLDERTDKLYFHIVTAALIARAVKNGHHSTAAALTANMALTGARDTLKTIERSDAKKHSIPTHASRLGKYKASLQGIGLGVLTSPVQKLVLVVR